MQLLMMVAVTTNTAELLDCQKEHKLLKGLDCWIEGRTCAFLAFKFVLLQNSSSLVC